MYYLLLILNVFVVQAEIVSDEDLEFWHTGFRKSLYPPLPIAFPWSEDEQCRKDSQLVVDNLKNHTLWAVQMYESSEREILGVLYGYNYHLGYFDECMQVQQPIKSQMCLALYTADTSAVPINPSNPYDLDPPYNESAFKKIRDSHIDLSKYPRYLTVAAVCVPRSCSQDAIKTSMNAYLDRLNVPARLANQTTYSVSFFSECETTEKAPFRADEIAFWICALGIVLLALISTFMDLKGYRVHKLLILFSVRRNWQKFISHEQEPSHLDFLYGFRLISTLLLLFFHRLAVTAGGATVNFQTFESTYRTIPRIVLANGDLGIGTFFYISGLLSLYLIMEVREKRYVSPITIMISRYVRLIPLYMFVIWFYASVLLRTSDGVTWNYVLKNESLFCAENWWTNALFINNYVNAEHMCLLQSWYLSCDYQLFLICVIVTYTIINHRKIGLSILVGLIIISLLIGGATTIYYKLPPLLIFYHDLLLWPRQHRTFIWHYIKTYNRSESYFIGMLCGYVLFKTKNTKQKFGMVTSLLLVLVAHIIITTFSIYGGRYYDIEYKYGLTESGVFCVGRRVAWVLGISVIAAAFRYGHIPIFKSLFASKCVIILSKLSLSMYLIHFVYQMMDHGNDRTAQEITYMNILTHSISDNVVVGFYSLILYLLIELPSRELFKELVFSRK